MLNEIIAIYAITDDLLKAVGHQNDCPAQLRDAEGITTALVAARFFSGNPQSAQAYLKDHELLPQRLSKSRFNRRWHRLFLPLLELFDYLGSSLKLISPTTEYLLDSFPVPICDNIRIPKVRLVLRRLSRLHCFQKASMAFGCICSQLVTGFWSNLPLSLPEDREIYADAAYTDYQAEDDLFDTDAIILQVARKRNSTRPDPPPLRYISDPSRY